VNKSVCALLAGITCIILSGDDTQNGRKFRYELLAETKSPSSKLCKISNGNTVIRVYHSTCALYAVDTARRAERVDIKNSLSSTSRLMHFLHKRDDIHFTCAIIAPHVIMSCTVECTNNRGRDPRFGDMTL